MRTFDEQMRQAIERWQGKDATRSLRSLARSASISPTTLIGWHADESRSLRLDYAERVARIIGMARLRATSGRSLPYKGDQSTFDGQLREAIGKRSQYDVAIGAGLARSSLSTYLLGKAPKISLRAAFAVCRYLSIDLINTELT